MDRLFAILVVCAGGYVYNHWDEFSGKQPEIPEAFAQPAPLVVYSSRTEPACVKLEGELTRQGIPFQRRDLSKELNARELTEKFARVGKMKESYAMPVAEINGFMVEAASINDIKRRLK